MAALILLVCLGLTVVHWLMPPLIGLFTPLAQVLPLPWVLLLALLWLLAGSPGPPTAGK